MYGLHIGRKNVTGELTHEPRLHSINNLSTHFSTSCISFHPLSFIGHILLKPLPPTAPHWRSNAIDSELATNSLAINERKSLAPSRNLSSNALYPESSRVSAEPEIVPLLDCLYLQRCHRNPTKHSVLPHLCDERYYTLFNTNEIYHSQRTLTMSGAPGFYLTDDDQVCYVDEWGIQYRPNPQMDPHSAYHYGLRYIQDGDGIYYYEVRQEWQR